MGGDKFKIVITDLDHPTYEHEQRALADSGLAATLELESFKTPEDIIAGAADADALINQYTLVTREVFAALKNLKVVCRYGIGVDNIDVKAATDHGVVVVNVPDYCLDEVAVQALALILAAFRKTVGLNNSVKAGTWDFSLYRPIRRLSGLTAGFAGLGKIARNLAGKLSSFGLELIAYDPYLDSAPEGIQLVGFSDLLTRSDIISIHAPLTDETRHMFGEAEFQAMKKSAILVNTSRGALIDEIALTKALESGRIAGCGLDVTDPDWW
jgi:D-3-phosphoglycerate dehydrogenase